MIDVDTFRKVAAILHRSQLDPKDAAKIYILLRGPGSEELAAASVERDRAAFDAAYGIDSRPIRDLGA